MKPWATFFRKEAKFAAEPKAHGNVWSRKTGTCVAVPEHTQRQTYGHPWFHLLHHLDLPKDCSHPILPVLPPKISQTPSFHTYDRCCSFGLYLNYCVRVHSHFSSCPTWIFSASSPAVALSWHSPCGHSGYSSHQQNVILTYFMPLSLCICCSFSLEYNNSLAWFICSTSFF